MVTRVDRYGSISDPSPTVLFLQVRAVGELASSFWMLLWGIRLVWETWRDTHQYTDLFHGGSIWAHSQIICSIWWRCQETCSCYRQVQKSVWKVPQRYIWQSQVQQPISARVEDLIYIYHVNILADHCGNGQLRDEMVHDRIIIILNCYCANLKKSMTHRSQTIKKKHLK